MPELYFLIDSIMKIVVGAFLLRLLCQLVRADFRNPLVQAIVRLTNPLVIPLRRILPPIGRIDTASVVAVVLVELVHSGLLLAIQLGGVPPLLSLLFLAIVKAVDTALLIFLFATVLYVVLSWVAPGQYSPLGALLDSLVEPLMRPFRRALPPLGGLDLSAFAVTILLVLLRMILNDRILPALLSLR